VLAGGRATRMGGGDKPLRLLAGRPMLDWVLAALRPAHDRIALSANGDPARFAVWDLPVLPDDPAFTQEGPLAGVLAGLRWAGAIGAEALLVVPGDAPFLPGDLALRLAPGPAYAVMAGQAHPLPALLPVGVAGPLALWLGAGRPRRVRAFLNEIGARGAEFGASSPFFANVNTPADLAAAEAGLTR
jgi:molybdopterin-guanine dinucleotide biosynthesis protein A